MSTASAGRACQGQCQLGVTQARLTVSGNVGVGIGLGDVSTALANHEAKLDCRSSLAVELRWAAR